MKVMDQIAARIRGLPPGHVFGYTDISTEAKQKEAVIKGLNRMAASGKIAKLSRGKFYKPEPSPFGELPPPREQVVKDLLERRGKVEGYLTGLSVYPEMGLTTQVSNTIQIGKNETRPAFRRGRYKIAFIKQKNRITRETIPLLQLLDAMRLVKRIPDTTVAKACKRFTHLVGQRSPGDVKTLLALAMKYPPSTRALLGAVLDGVAPTLDTKKLKQSLNPITRYRISGAADALPTAGEWNIE
jgi:hypothetical protein